MNELQAIVHAWRRREPHQREAILATVVHVRGSAYRRPGARMLILPDGQRIGSISGGCLEGEVCRRAWWLTEGGRPTVRIYDTSAEDDAVFEFGLGCNGAVHVLLERVGSASAHQLLVFLERYLGARQRVLVATVIGAEPGTGVETGDRLLIGANGGADGALAGTALARALSPHVRQARQRGSTLVHLAGVDVFVEWIAPPLPLVIFGAGHDAIPVVAFAKQLGWHVTIADGRPAYATAARFPGVDRVVLLRRDDPLADIVLDRDTAVVVMTHNFPQDAALLQALLPARPRYLGVLGAPSRSARLLDEIGVGAEAIDIHAPVGLDIGADAPELIALAIVAEIQATISERAGGKLRLRHGPIHAAVAEAGAASPTVPQAHPEQPVCELAADRA